MEGHAHLRKLCLRMTLTNDFIEGKDRSSLLAVGRGIRLTADSRRRLWESFQAKITPQMYHAKFKWQGDSHSSENEVSVGWMENVNGHRLMQLGWSHFLNAQDAKSRVRPRILIE